MSTLILEHMFVCVCGAGGDKDKENDSKDNVRAHVRVHMEGYVGHTCAEAIEGCLPGVSPKPD